MSEHPPTYRAAGKVFRADACQALIAAAKRGDVQVKGLARGTYPGIRLASRDLPQLKAVGFWDAAITQTWGLGWHRNEGIELTYLESGSLGFAVERERFFLEPGDLTITRPWQLHRVGEPYVTPGRLHWIILDVDMRKPHQPWHWPSWLVLSRNDLRTLTMLLRSSDKPVWPGTREVESCFQRIARLIEERSDAVTLISRLALLINELLIIMLETLREHTVPAREEQTPAERATRHFLAALAQSPEEPWTLETMAAAAGLGRTRFAHYCHKLTNRTPNEYLVHRRLEKSRQMLHQNAGQSLTSIAMDCGFSSGQYFSTLFRKEFGLAPARYRAVQRQQQLI